MIIFQNLNYVLIVYAGLLGGLHLLCENLPLCVGRNHSTLLSFASGAFLSLIFLIILPEVAHPAASPYVYPLILLGFSTFFLAEKYLYQHVKDPEVLETDLYHLHVSGFFIDHFIKGFILVTIIDLNPVMGFVSALPFLIHALSSSIVLENIHQIKENLWIKIALSSSLLLGTLTAVYLEVGLEVERSALAFALGMLIFMVIRDILPKKEKGKPLFFFFGMGLVLILWLIIEIAAF